MGRLALAAAVAIAGAVLAGTAAIGGHEPRYRPLPDETSWTTVLTMPGVGVEGLTADRHGNLYTPGRGVTPCPILRGSPGGGTPVVVGNIAAPCNPLGLAFDRHGTLFIADSGRIVTLRPNAANPPTATVYATDVPGAQRRRVRPRRPAVGQRRLDGAGPRVADRRRPRPGRGLPRPADGQRRQPRRRRRRRRRARQPRPTARHDRHHAERPPGRDTLGSQHIVANGLAFDRDALYVADTARGAIWRVRIDHKGRLQSRTGCDSTFTSNTLCLENVLVAHPYLEGADGITLDRGGNLLTAVNERNAIVVVAKHGTVELFRNPVAATRLRNEGPLEFPTSPVIVGRTLCVASSDGARRDNFPSAPGEGAKVSCLDEDLPVR